MRSTILKILLVILIFVPAIFFSIAERRGETIYDIIFVPRLWEKGSLIIESRFGTVDFQLVGHVHSKGLHWSHFPANSPFAAEIQSSLFPVSKYPMMSFEWNTMKGFGFVFSLGVFIWYLTVIIKGKAIVRGTRHHNVEQAAAGDP